MDNRKKFIIAIAFTAIIVTSLFLVRSLTPISSITVPDDYSSIQSAVDHALDGQTILVRKGTYTEQQITIDKTVSLIGENPENTILVGINNIKYAPPYVIQLSADNVKVSGFTITNGSLGGIRVETIGSVRQPTGCEISNNIVKNSGIGISSYGGASLSISNNTVINNRESGIAVTTSHSNVYQNTINGNGGMGITIDSSIDVSVYDNAIAGNGGGLGLRWFGDFKIYSNQILDNNGSGVEFGEGCSNSLVYSNDIKCNSVGVKLANFALTNNSEGIGIGTGNRVYQNNLDNNQNAIIETAYPYGDISNIMYAIGNGTDVVSWDNGNEGNYWSDYQSRYSNASEIDSSGIWDTPYAIDEGNIDHYPLMLEASTSTPKPTQTRGPTSPESISSPMIPAIIAVIIGLIRLDCLYI